MTKEEAKEGIQLKAAMLVIEQDKKMITEIIEDYEGKIQEVSKQNKQLLEKEENHITEKRDLEESVKILSGQLSSLYASKSWKLTRPVRYIGNFVKKY